MNWFKTATEVQIGAHDSTGRLVVYIDGKRYVYTGSNPHLLQRLKWGIKYSRFSDVFRILKSLNQEFPEPQTPSVKKKPDSTLFDSVEGN
tara:strand:- start:1887 stop:2156 length:270 start_codon:yes stop_codon:yes gene_type:complete